MLDESKFRLLRRIQNGEIRSQDTTIHGSTTQPYDNVTGEGLPKSPFPSGLPRQPKVQLLGADSNGWRKLRELKNWIKTTFCSIRIIGWGTGGRIRRFNALKKFAIRIYAFFFNCGGKNVIRKAHILSPLFTLDAVLRISRDSETVEIEEIKKFSYLELNLFNTKIDEMCPYRSAMWEKRLDMGSFCLSGFKRPLASVLTLALSSTGTTGLHIEKQAYEVPKLLSGTNWRWWHIIAANMAAQQGTGILVHFPLGNPTRQTPHGADVANCCMRICDVHNIPLAPTLLSAELMSSHNSKTNKWN